MFDHRHETTSVRVVRVLWFVVCSFVAIAFVYKAGSELGDPASAIHRYRAPAVAPHVFVRGKLRREPKSPVPALCSVTHERYQSCGKSRCWRYYEGIVSSRAILDVSWSSSPLPASLQLRSQQRVEPRWPSSEVVSGERSKTWKEIAQRANLGFQNSAFGTGSSDRIVEACLDEGEEVFVEACVAPGTSDVLEACPGQRSFGVVAGEPQLAIDAAASDVAYSVAGAFCALFVGSLAFLRKRSPVAEGLEDRAAPHRRVLGAGWALLAIPPIATFGNLLLHASGPRSTWSIGRGGFVLGITALTLWTVFALSRLLHRNRTLAALGPVLATPRSLLAHASGTAELAVRARLRNGGLRAFIGDDVVAFSQLRISESYRQGKNTSTRELCVFRPTNELEVVDESGDGVLDLSHAIVDVELRKVSVQDLAARYAERGVVVERHPNHVTYQVEERVIRDGEPLYVFGHVSGLELRSAEQGYRSVRGAPRLGGADNPPVLVYAGDERGLVASLSREARTANSLAVVAALAATLLAGALGYLASL